MTADAIPVDPISDEAQAALYEFTKNTPHYGSVRVLYRLASAYVNAEPLDTRRSASPRAEAGRTVKIIGDSITNQHGHFQSGPGGFSPEEARRLLSGELPAVEVDAEHYSEVQHQARAAAILAAPQQSPARTAADAPAANPPSEFWLIERGSNEGQSPMCWWVRPPADLKRGYARYSEGTWTTNVHDASKFSTRDEAKDAAKADDIPQPYAITSHGYMAPPASPSASEGVLGEPVAQKGGAA